MRFFKYLFLKNSNFDENFEYWKNKVLTKILNIEKIRIWILTKKSNLTKISILNKKIRILTKFLFPNFLRPDFANENYFHKKIKSRPNKTKQKTKENHEIFIFSRKMNNFRNSLKSDRQNSGYFGRHLQWPKLLPLNRMSIIRGKYLTNTVYLPITLTS